jgi:hypothetical protein
LCRTDDGESAEVADHQQPGHAAQHGVYVFGTKKELKEQRIMVDGKVLQSSFNKSYFTKIDIRVDKEIKLYSKSAKLLHHPSFEQLHSSRPMPTSSMFCASQPPDFLEYQQISRGAGEVRHSSY